MHGDKSQSQREKALARFESGRVKTLVATDVAARGIDVARRHARDQLRRPGRARGLRPPRRPYGPRRRERRRHHVRARRPGPRRREVRRRARAGARPRRRGAAAAASRNVNGNGTTRPIGRAAVAGAGSHSLPVCAAHRRRAAHRGPRRSCAAAPSAQPAGGCVGGAAARLPMGLAPLRLRFGLGVRMCHAHRPARHAEPALRPAGADADPEAAARGRRPVRSCPPRSSRRSRASVSPCGPRTRTLTDEPFESEKRSGALRRAHSRLSGRDADARRLALVALEAAAGGQYAGRPIRAHSWSRKRGRQLVVGERRLRAGGGVQRPGAGVEAGRARRGRAVAAAHQPRGPRLWPGSDGGVAQAVDPCSSPLRIRSVGAKEYMT